ncbi:molybdopterin molybdotransferase MoeA [Nitratifractor salsuginis]|uniref:Molybdopterin molybdenumtransferase n=1 Tax=Nitratifractor salsuginis (strain DSM 16511 / JCM 12458 / E9I37-1) TaxID=749222 RepID=E6X265_NITSE|nr:molybdopterin molybdotransferase MoeA [Nitratifractor salsuginis]ADV47134.1 molybdenum cofactor synthesis domain protein [Nitratifractor salsuginis DSM 16511]
MVKLDTLSLKEALGLALENAPLKREREIVTLDRALGRILAQEVKVRKNLPSFDNSAMDGFAFRYGDGGKRLRIAATIFAGDRPEAILEEGECYRIMTGAQVPADADTIVPIEKCSDVTDEAVTIPEGIKRGSNLRKRGEELDVGTTLLEAGTVLEPSHIALLSSQGLMAAEVTAPLRIAVLSSGDEIREPWEEAEEDEIYNANAFGIIALLQRYGFAAEYHGRIPDDRESTVAMLGELKRYDVIFTSGGISTGEADFLYEAFLANGLEPLFHGVNVKPGRPTMMGRMGRSFVMAMPGNPLATMLNILVLAIPVLFRMQGARSVRHRRFSAAMGEVLKLRGGRSEMVLGRMREGRFFPTRGNRYGSGMLTPLAESDVLAIFGEEVRELPEGTSIEVIPLWDAVEFRNDSQEG